MRTRTGRALAVVVTVLVVGLTGCGDDDDDDAGDGATDTSTTAAPAGSGGSGEGAASVTIKDFAFSPTELTAATGDTISVKNDDSTAHTFTSDEAGFDVKLDAGGSGEAQVAAPAPGTYDFRCTIHESMKGTITVT